MSVAEHLFTYEIPWNDCQMINRMEIMQFDPVLKNKCYGFPLHAHTQDKFFATLDYSGNDRFV